MQKEIKVLKVRFDKTTLEKASQTVLIWAKESTKRYVTTPNPEILLEAQKNHKLLEILNKSDLNIADGVGILWAAKYLKIKKYTPFTTIKFAKGLISLLATLIYPKYIKDPLPQRVTGVDLMENICKEAASKNIRIFLLGAEEGIANKVRDKLKKKYPGVNIVGTYSGSPKPEEENHIRSVIDRTAADAVFVAFGAPVQEIWISRNLSKLRTVKVAMGVGGSFDFIAEKRKRAPKIMRKLGLEWLYRLIQEPKRYRRIYNAVIKFPLQIFQSNIK